jgi:hypothetical protein
MRTAYKARDLVAINSIALPGWAEGLAVGPPALGDYSDPLCLAVLTQALQACMTHAHGIQGVVAEQVEGAAVFAAEEDVVRTLGDVDAA